MTGHEAVLEAAESMLAEAEATGDPALGRAARRLLDEADSRYRISEARRQTVEGERDAREFMRDIGADPALLEQHRPSAEEQLRRFVVAGDLEGLREALDSGDPAVAEQIREAAA